MSSDLTPFAFVHAGTKNANGVSVGQSAMTTRIKTDFLGNFPGARLEFRKTDRINGQNVNVFWILVPKGAEHRYAQMIERIGEQFHQGNGFAIYKWKKYETATPTLEPTHKQASRIGYNMSNTWGAALAPEIAATVIHCPRRAK